MILFLPMRIHVLALGGAFDTGLAAVLDTFGVADELSHAGRKPARRFEVELVSVRKSVRTGRGLQVPARTVSKADRPDVLFVAALDAKTPDSLERALATKEVRDAALYLRSLPNGTLVVAACTATFVLAEAGLLSGRRATTTWWLAPMFRQRYHDVQLDESEIIVPARSVVTAGAALAHLDLALWIVRRQSPSLAARVARFLVADLRPSQAAYVIPDQLAHSDPVVERFERWVTRHLAEGFSLNTAARAVGVSSRTLARRLHTVLGKTPVAYVQELRIDRAIDLLQTSNASVDEIAERVGYAQGTTLRTLLRRRRGRGVKEIRTRA